MTGTDTKPTRKPRTPKGAPQRPTVTDAEYAKFLAIRLTAMHGFEKGEVTAEVKNLARKAVRDARKVRKDEAQILVAWNEYEAKLEAEKVAKPRKPRAKKPATSVATTTEPTVPVTEPAQIAS